MSDTTREAAAEAKTESIRRGAAMLCLSPDSDIGHLLAEIDRLRAAQERVSTCDVTGCLDDATHSVGVSFSDDDQTRRPALPGHTFRACYGHAVAYRVAAMESPALECWIGDVTDDAGDPVMVGDDS